MIRLFGTVTPEPDNTLTRHAHRHGWARFNAPQTTTETNHLTQRGFDLVRICAADIADAAPGAPGSELA